MSDCRRRSPYEAAPPASRTVSSDSAGSEAGEMVVVVGGAGGREEEMETEEVTVDPPGIYDACRRAINANVAEPATASRSIPGSRFIRFWRGIKILPAYLSLDSQVFRNQPLITRNI